MMEDTVPNGSPGPMLFKPEKGEVVVSGDGFAQAPSAAPQQPMAAQPAPPPPAANVAPNQFPVPQGDAVTWTASEFIAHQKSFVWYLILGLIAAGLAALVWFLTKDTFATGATIVGAILLGVYASHKPRQLNYAVDDYGLTIGQRHRTYDEFRSFTIIPEGAFSSIEFAPLKRFATFTTIYYHPDDEDRILDVIAAHLPMEERDGDIVDQLLRRIRF
jgi:hypothetical protein